MGKWCIWLHLGDSYRSTHHPSPSSFLFVFTDIRCVTSLWYFMGDDCSFYLLCPSASLVTTINAKKACSNLTWTEIEHRRIVSSRQKAAQKSCLPHHSSKLSCSVFFLESDYKNVEGERSAEGMSCTGSCQGFLGLLKKAAALVETIPWGFCPFSVFDR